MYVRIEIVDLFIQSKLLDLFLPDLEVECLSVDPPSSSLDSQKALLCEMYVCYLQIHGLFSVVVGFEEKIEDLIPRCGLYLCLGLLFYCHFLLGYCQRSINLCRFAFEDIVGQHFTWFRLDSNRIVLLLFVFDFGRIDERIGK